MTKYLLDALAGWCMVSIGVVLVYDFMRLFDRRSPRAAWPFQMTSFGCMLAGLLYVIRSSFNAEQLRSALTIAGAVFAVLVVCAAVLALRGKR